MADPTRPEPQKIDPIRPGSKFFDPDPSLIFTLFKFAWNIWLPFLYAKHCPSIKKAIEYWFYCWLGRSSLGFHSFQPDHRQQHISYKTWIHNNNWLLRLIIYLYHSFWKIKDKLKVFLQDFSKDYSCNLPGIATSYSCSFPDKRLKGYSRFLNIMLMFGQPVTISK